MAWDHNGSFTVFHGTIGRYANDIYSNGIQLAKCLPKADFSRGFYTTRIRSQAVRFANNKFRVMQALHATNSSGIPAPGGAAVVQLTIRLAALAAMDTLGFVQPTIDWREFIEYCRQPSDGHKGPQLFFDAVFGPVANPTGDAYPDLEQLSFHTSYAISQLTRVRVVSGSPTL
jgi:hypothetical protein